ncbi:hypothetical protein KDA_14980 [Dictyobacter alpinus]|uniref:Baseplate protein J-like barrel domain-containing protein n=1 Tax=Dictyobacter alpinus TaxID=2014873 RepID=A0A402B3S4_9CHLR|nr:baseplate J/gp47 family protein [Dictyobacter alpinus]GCE26014.1 hypothetical protein KDA_14980 [Dictyobacter alpinus]
MSDEQTIYISPEDDLTTVRERLEQIQTRKVTLVVPAQTQLRSHVAWKLLYARARELGKDVLIVSSDPQVRSVAHAVKFNVAHSLESSQQGRSRPTGRPARSAPATNRTKTANPNQRATPARPGRSTNSLRSRQSNARPSSELANRGQESIDYQVPEDIEDVNTTIFQPSEHSFEAPYTTPQIRPLDPDQIEDPDLLVEDYTQSQHIRRAAGESPSEPDFVPPTPQTKPAQKTKTKTTRSRVAPQALDADEDNEDPFVALEDKQPPPVAEQRGGAVVEDPGQYDHVVQDVADFPTSVIGDDFNFSNEAAEAMPAPPQRGARNRNRQLDEEASNQSAQPRPASERPRQRRSGKMVPPPPPVSDPAGPHLRSEDLDDDDELPPVERRPTPIQDRDTFVYEPASRGSNKSPDLIPLPVERPRNYGARSGSTQQRQSPSQRTGGASLQRPPATNLRPSGTLRPAPRPSQDLRSRKQLPAEQQRKKSSNILIWIIAAIFIILFLALALGAYFAPTATATITIAARNYSHPVSILASSNNQANSIPAQELVHEFTQQGPEPVTGSKLVGTAKATGNVCFSNNGDIPVLIPTGTNVSSTGANGVLFKTTAEASIPKQTTCATFQQPVPVEALKAGETGNMQAGTVTVIPDASLESIASYSNTTVAKLKLAVINIGDIKGGGMQPVPSITQKDLDNATTDLHKKLQGQIDAWVKGLPQDGALGKLDTTDALINPPARDSISEGGKTFPAQLKVTAHILYVSHNDLQNTTRAQINADMKNDKNFASDTVLSDSPQAITITKLKAQTPNKNTLKLDFTATAHVAGTFKKDELVNMIAWQTPDAASQQLKAQFHNIQDVKITRWPDFMPILPANKNNITIKVVPGTIPATS